jgi:Family of unknown function (DUF5684)
MNASAAAPAMAGGVLLFFAVLLAVMIAGVWGIFAKAGEAPWKCLVPIYGAFVFQRIIGRPGWWALLLFVPVVNLVFSLIECFDLARVFGKGMGYAFGLALLGPLFALMLAYGPAHYVGPSGETPAAPIRKAA